MAKTSTERSNNRWAKAAAVIPQVALDVEHASKLTAILEQTRESRTQFVRRAIREEFGSMRFSTDPTH